MGELHDILMIIPNSFGAVLFPPKRRRGANEVLPIDDETVYKPVLYSIASVLVFKALCGGLTKNASVSLMIRYLKLAAALTVSPISPFVLPHPPSGFITATWSRQLPA